MMKQLVISKRNKQFEFEYCIFLFKKICELNPKNSLES